MTQIVTLFARPRFVTLPREIHDDVMVKYGSFFNTGTRAVARGLTREEEEYNLPSHIDVSPADVMNWAKATKDFWANLSRSVSVKEGAILNITHQVIKKKVKVTKIFAGQEHVEDVEVNIRVPEVIEDFCIYTLCEMDSSCAVTEEELELKEGYSFHVLNPESLDREKKEKYKAQKEAGRIYAELSSAKVSDEDKAKIIQIINFFKSELVDLDMFPVEGETPDNAILSREMAIKELSTAFPEELVKAFNDTNLMYKAKINNLLDKGELKKEGNSYFNNDDEEIATDYAALVRYMKAASNQGAVSKMQAKATVS